MLRRRLFLTTTICALASQAPADPAVSGAPATRLPVATVRFEQNVTDQDVEVVFQITGGDEGLTKLTIVAPDGRTAVDFNAPVASTLGIRKFLFESPEPKDLESLKAAYPEGAYTFTGTTGAGERFEGAAELHHDLPGAVLILKPEPESKGVALRGATIAWKAVAGAENYIIELEAAEGDASFEATLPGSKSQLAVPEGFLVPNTEYTLGIGSVTAAGNRTFVETSFTTAAGK